VPEVDGSDCYLEELLWACRKQQAGVTVPLGAELCAAVEIAGCAWAVNVGDRREDCEFQNFKI